MNKKKLLILLAISCALTSTAVALVSTLEDSAARRGTNSSVVTFGVASPQRADGLGVPDDLVRRDSFRVTFEVHFILSETDWKAVARSVSR